MVDQALRFVLDVVFGLFTYAFLLRFLMQWQRAPFRNPLSQAVVALTDWAVKPLRRVLPGFGGLDWSTLLLAYLAQFLWLLAVTLLIGGGLTGAGVVAVAVLAVLELVKTTIWLLIIVVIVQAILSWVAPDGPLAGLLNALTFRFLAPIRRLPFAVIGGTLDLSPLILIVILQLILMLPMRWLESAVVAALRG